MILDVDSWMRRLDALLFGQFGQRLLFLGLQGSYRRGEANAHSDIDVVLVLDQMGLQELAAYKRVLAQMPESELACGFACGAQELRGWARSDLFQLLHDTRAYRGELPPLIGEPPTPDDIRAGARVAVGNLYHEACHRYLYGGDLAQQAEALRGAYKAAFYAVQALEYLRTGDYCPTRAALIERAQPGDREMLLAYRDWDARADAPAARFEALIKWCQHWLCE